MNCLAESARDQDEVDELRGFGRRNCDGLRANREELNMNQYGMGAVIDQAPSELGLTGKEKDEFSIARIVRAQVNPADRRLQKEAAFEFDVCEAAKRHYPGESRGIVLPAEILTHRRSQRGLTVGTAADGGYLKGTDLMGSSFIDMFRNKCMCIQIGATEMPGLTSDVAIPRLNSGSTGYWVAEDTDITAASVPVFGQMTLAPKIVGAYSELSKKLLAQSDPVVDLVVKSDLTATLATAVDLAALHGAGGAEPTGIFNTTGVDKTTVAGGTAGAAPTYAHLIALEALLSTHNADLGAMAVLTNAKVRAKLRATFPNTVAGDTPVWTAEGGRHQVIGMPAYATNQVRSNLEKGGSGAVCSAIFMGDWSQLIVATWTGIDLIVDTATLSKKGGVRIVALQLVDIGIRRPESFVVMADALTV